MEEQSHKTHHVRQAGRKHDRKALKKTEGHEKHAKGNNWKAFSVQKVGKATRRLQHASDKYVRRSTQPPNHPTTTSKHTPTTAPPCSCSAA